MVSKLTNEAHGAAGSKDDRALYVQSVAVNGKAAPGKTLTMQSAIGIEPTAMLGDYLVVSEGAVEGVAAAPGGAFDCISLTKMPEMVGGVLFEHGHRMAATFVGFLTLILSIWTVVSETFTAAR